MNHFDFVQINAPLDCIQEINYRMLGKELDEDNVISKHTLTAKRRRELCQDRRIGFSISNERVNFGFSSKILDRNYRNLIHKDNIADCFNILSEKYKLFKSINMDRILDEGFFNRLEVTKDINMKLEESDYRNMQNLVIEAKWNQLLPKTGIPVKSGFGVMHSGRGQSIIIYDKEDEMNLLKNRKYVEENQHEHTFRGMTRVEAKLNSIDAIKKRFATNSVNSVLESDINPLIELLAEVFPTSQLDHRIFEERQIINQRDRERLSYAKEYNFSYKDICKDLRRRDKQNWRRRFIPIQMAIEGMENTSIPKTYELLELIKESLVF